MKTSENPLTQQVSRVYELAPQLAALGYQEFLSQLVIDTVPDPRPFRQIAFDWQWEDAKVLTPPLEQITGHRPFGSYTGPLNFWFSRARGHNKTSSLAWLLGWAMSFQGRLEEAIEVFRRIASRANAAV